MEDLGSGSVLPEEPPPTYLETQIRDQTQPILPTLHYEVLPRTPLYFPSENIMLSYLVEFLGTFLFLSVILITGQALPIAIALASVIFFGSKISGGHFNPAVSIMMTLRGSLAPSDLILYILSQVLGGISALLFVRSAGLA